MLSANALQFHPGRAPYVSKDTQLWCVKFCVSFLTQQVSLKLHHCPQWVLSWASHPCYKEMALGSTFWWVMGPWWRVKAVHNY